MVNHFTIRKSFKIYLLKQKSNKITTTDDQTEYEKLQYDINREAAEISGLSRGTIAKYEYFAGEEILYSNQKQITEQAKFTYSPLGKTFEKETIEAQGKKQVDTSEALKSNTQ